MLSGVTASGNRQEGGEDAGSQLRSQGEWEQDLQWQCQAWMQMEGTWAKEDGAVQMALEAQGEQGW